MHPPRSLLLTSFAIIVWAASTRWTLVTADAETRAADVGVGGGGDGAAMSIGKCCESEEILVNDRCTSLKETNETKWRPEFVEQSSSSSGASGRSKFAEPKYELKIGRPRCASDEHQWHVYYYPTGPDRLAILSSGVLRHYVDLVNGMDEKRGVYGGGVTSGLDDDEEDDESASIYYDYQFGHYCIDKVVLNGDPQVATYAMLCVPTVAVRWSDTNYFLRHAVDPAFHAISTACYLVVAVIYFVLPQLRDLVGNIITSIALCLVVNQCASTVRIFTEFGNHVSFLIAGTQWMSLKYVAC